MEFKGAFTALITPFRNNEIDEDALRKHIEYQIAAGIDGLVPCGTTGESATMTHDEHKRVIRICIDQAGGRVPVLAGTGSNNTSEAVELTGFAKQAGADGALLITPYYNKPTQAGVVAHFKAVAGETSLPLVVYNVPGRTGTNVLPETMGRMAREIPEVIGVKEASGNINQISEVIEYCGPDFSVLAGDDFVILPLMAIGGRGVVSVVSNLLPGEVAGLCAACAGQDMTQARKLHFELAPLCRAMFLESNPIPVKTALALINKSGLEFRLPLVEMQPENKSRLQEVLSRLSLL
ncbi:MAG: 4-hydroxy-tetrahydrodipicolinate synthase [Desulfohalobiaceae bacterium]|nr:4-hydroxy-tetrahydrodipicolinate synthase [Desulfohalobiaceae bacterium]